MAITFVGAGAVVSNSNLVGTTGISLSPHANQLTDDLMIAFMHRNQDDGGWSAAPTGWTTLAAEETGDGQDRATQICYRIATADGEGSSTFKNTDTTGEQWAGCILTYRGVDTTTPIDVAYVTGSHFTALQNKASPNVDAFDSITTVTDGAFVIALEAVTHDDITSNADPSGYTNAVRNIGSAEDHRQFQVWHKEVSTAGAETPGAPAYTSNATVAESHQYTIAIRPAASSDTDVSASTDALTLTEQAATITLDVSVSAGADSLTLTEQAASIVYDVDVTAGTDALTLSNHSATVSNDVEVSASTDALTVATFAVSVELDVNVDTSADALTLTEFSATISTDDSIVAGTHALSLTTFPATIGKDVSIAAATHDLVLSEYAATITTANVQKAIGGGPGRISDEDIQFVTDRIEAEELLLIEAIVIAIEQDRLLH
jgi:hypothetical protein